MKNIVFAAIVLALLPAAAYAADDQNITGVAKDQHPGTSGASGTTADPTAKPDTGSLSAQQKSNEPGVNANVGTTAAPTAKPDDSSLPTAQKKATGQQ